MVLSVSHLAIFAGFLLLSAAVALNSTTPSVDLGYEIHTATTNVILPVQYNILKAKSTSYTDNWGLLHIQ
jgi:hypothetical protein